MTDGRKSFKRRDERRSDNDGGRSRFESGRGRERGGSAETAGRRARGGHGGGLVPTRRDQTLTGGNKTKDGPPMSREIQNSKTKNFFFKKKNN